MRKNILFVLIVNLAVFAVSISVQILIFFFGSNLLVNIILLSIPILIGDYISTKKFYEESSREINLCFLRSAYRVLSWHKAACEDTIRVNLNRERSRLPQIPPYQFTQSFSVYELEIRETLLQMYRKSKVDDLCNGWKSNYRAFSEKVAEVRAKVNPTATECDVYHLPLK